MKKRLVMTGTLGTQKPDQLKAFETLFLERFPEGEFEFLNDMPVSDDELIAKIKEANVIITIYQKLTEKVYAATTPHLRAAISYGIGYDSCNVPAATKYNVAVANMPDWCQEEVAVHTVTMILATHRGVLPTIRALDQGRWTDRFSIVAPVTRFSFVTVGFFGFGKIAQLASKMLKNFGVRLIAHDPYMDKAKAEEIGVKLVDFPTLIGESNYLSVHAPLLPTTAKIINGAVFNKMRKDAVLVNTSRGGLVDPDALYDALTKGKIRGAALDVFVTEPPSGIEAEICKLPNVLSSPHIAYYSEESYRELMSKTVDEAIRVLKGERPINLINKEIENNLGWIKK